MQHYIDATVHLLFNWKIEENQSGNIGFTKEKTTWRSRQFKNKHTSISNIERQHINLALI